MAGDANALISGSAMAVLIGAAMILAGLFADNIGTGTSFGLFILGGFFVWIGLQASRA